MKLHLRANEYSNSAAVHELVNGAWPLLEELSLADCIEGLAGLQCLVTSKALQMHPSDATSLAGCYLCTSSVPQCSGLQLL